jgi:hypothetical protein
LALVLVAGTLAAEAGLLPFEILEIINAATAVRDAWLGDDSNQPSAVLGKHALKDFILRHQAARFRDAKDRTNGGTVVRDQVGYVDRERGLFLFTAAGLREACAGYDMREVLKELLRRRHLFVNDTGKLKSKHTIDGDGRMSLYAVKASLLEDEE